MNNSSVWQDVLMLTEMGLLTHSKKTRLLTSIIHRLYRLSSAPQSPCWDGAVTCFSPVRSQPEALVGTSPGRVPVSSAGQLNCPGWRWWESDLGSHLPFLSPHSCSAFLPNSRSWPVVTWVSPGNAMAPIFHRLLHQPPQFCKMNLL